MRLALLLAFLSACKDPAQPARAPSRDAAVSAAPRVPGGAASHAAETAADAAPVTDPAVSARAACVDAKLGALHLNPYGDPIDTVYAGGSPLFDEKTGAARDRIQYVLAKRPDLEQACAAR